MNQKFLFSVFFLFVFLCLPFDVFAVGNIANTDLEFIVESLFDMAAWGVGGVVAFYISYKLLQAKLSNWAYQEAKEGKADKTFTALETIESIKIKASQGDPEYQYRYAKCLDRGEGVSIDAKEALKGYCQASDSGHAAAAYEIGRCFNNGWVVSESNNEALRWFGLAAERKHPEAVRIIRGHTEPPRPASNSDGGSLLLAGLVGFAIGNMGD